MGIPVNWWCCPICNWEPPESYVYYCIYKGGAISRVECTNGRVQATPIEPHKAYPVYSDYTYSDYAAREFGLNGHDWQETHCCPNCLKEFAFSNSDF